MNECFTSLVFCTILFSFKPRVLVVAYRRSYDAIKDHGRNVTVAWKPDSTGLAVSVSTSDC